MQAVCFAAVPCIPAGVHAHLPAHLHCLSLCTGTNELVRLALYLSAKWCNTLMYPALTLLGIEIYPTTVRHGPAIHFILHICRLPSRNSSTSVGGLFGSGISIIVPSTLMINLVWPGEYRSLTVSFSMKPMPTIRRLCIAH
jgi:hypothetical protein